MIKNRLRISKFLSLILRHKAREYDLCLDRYGFADLEKVYRILKEKFPFLRRKDIKYIVETEPRQRFQIKERKIRARYGHSIEVEPLKETREIPDILFHGTSPCSVSSILKEGLKPGRRRFVHLCGDINEALRVGRRKSPNPVILKVDARRARKDGLLFWKEAGVYLCKEVPSQYIRIQGKKEVKE